MSMFGCKDYMEEITRSASAQMAAERQRIVLEGIYRVVGDCFDIRTVANRVRIVRVDGSDFETVYVDETAVVEIHDPTTSLEGGELRCWLDHRFFCLTAAGWGGK